MSFRRTCTLIGKSILIIGPVATVLLLGDGIVSWIRALEFELGRVIVELMGTRPRDMASRLQCFTDAGKIGALDTFGR